MKSQTSLHIHAASPEPLLLAHTKIKAQTEILTSNPIDTSAEAFVHMQ